MRGHGRDILLLAAEDAFEFERWRDAGPLTADIDAEVSAAEIAEFEALGVPMPRELDSLKREMEHAPKVRDAIRNSALALRRSGRASSAALVALAPSGLVHPGMMDPRFGPMGAMGPVMMDPRFAAAAAAMAQGAPPAAARAPSRGRKVADVTVMADGGPVEAELVDGPPRAARRSRRPPEDDELDDFAEEDDAFDDDDDDDDELERAREAARARKRKKQRQRAKAKRERDWDEDEFDDDDSMIAAVPIQPAGRDQTTLILGGIAGVAILALLWVTFGKDEDQTQAQADAQQQQQQVEQPPPQPTQPPPAPAPAIDPNTGLPYGQAPAPTADAGAASPAPSARRGGGGGGGGGGGSRKAGGSSPSSPSEASAAPGAAGALGGLADLKGAPGSGPAGGQTAPAGGQTAPAGGQTPPAGDQPAPAGDQPAPAGDQPAPAGGQTAPAGDPTAPAGDKPAPAPPPEDAGIPKSAPGPAITQYAGTKATELFACLEDARVAKPDLAGKIEFTITIDGEGSVTEIKIAKDELGYGVGKCCKTKIKRWHFPAPGLPKRFGLPFQF